MLLRGDQKYLCKKYFLLHTERDTDREEKFLVHVNSAPLTVETVAE